MRDPSVRVCLAVTIDGFIAREDGSFDYLDAYSAAFSGWDTFMASIGSIVMGRVSYDQARSLNRWMYEEKRTYVLTNRPIGDPPEGVAVEAFTDPVALVDRLKSEGRGRAGHDIWHFGGGRAIAEFEKLGLIDRWELFVVPVRLGRGIPLFMDVGDTMSTLRLENVQEHKLGMVELHYESMREGTD